MGKNKHSPKMTLKSSWILSIISVIFLKRIEDECNKQLGDDFYKNLIDKRTGFEI